jgi:hypothetical protein
MFTAKKKGVIITKKEKEWWILVLIKIVFLFLVAGLVILGGVYYTKKKNQEQTDLVDDTEDEIREISPEETVDSTDRELAEIKDNFLKRITNLTPEEEEKIVNASSIEEAKKFFSAALTTRITNNLARCVLDKDGHIYVIMEDDDWIKSKDNWISEEEIAPFYGIGLFSKNDYQEIRSNFFAEIKKNPEKWELVRNLLGIVGLKEKGKDRMHSWQGFNFTEGEEEDIKETVDDVGDNKDEVLINDENLDQLQIPVWYLGPSYHVGTPAGHVFCSDIYDPTIPTGLLFIENGNPNLPNNLIERNPYFFVFASPNILLVEIGNNLNVYYTRTNRNFFLEERN